MGKRELSHGNSAQTPSRGGACRHISSVFHLERTYCPGFTETEHATDVDVLGHKNVQLADVSYMCFGFRKHPGYICQLYAQKCRRGPSRSRMPGPTPDEVDYLIPRKGSMGDLLICYGADRSKESKRK